MVDGKENGRDGKKNGLEIQMIPAMTAENLHRIDIFCTLYNIELFERIEQHVELDLLLSSRENQVTDVLFLHSDNVVSTILHNSNDLIKTRF